MGGQGWQGVSGVPGIGSSGMFLQCSSSTLQLWDDGKNKKNEKGGLLKLFRQFSIKTKFGNKDKGAPSSSASVVLPKVSLRRSKSLVSPSVVSCRNCDNMCREHNSKNKRTSFKNIKPSNKILAPKVVNNACVQNYSKVKVNYCDYPYNGEFCRLGQHRNSQLPISAPDIKSISCTKNPYPCRIRKNNSGPKLNSLSRDRINNHLANERNVGAMEVRDQQVSLSKNLYVTPNELGQNIRRSKSLHYKTDYKETSREERRFDDHIVRTKGCSYCSQLNYSLDNFGSETESDKPCRRHSSIFKSDRIKSKTVSFDPNIVNNSSLSNEKRIKDVISKNNCIHNKIKDKYLPSVSCENIKISYPEEEYSYTYSDHESPSKIIQYESDDKEENIYEEVEIIDKQEDEDKEDCMLSAVSKGRRNNLKLYKFADWDIDYKQHMDTNLTQDNYIRNIGKRKVSFKDN